MATPKEPSPKDLWREITSTETPDLDTFFARIWKNGLWGFFGPDFAAAWDSNLASFKEQIANDEDEHDWEWECRLGLTVTFLIPTDEYDAATRSDMVARIDFHRSETVDLSLEPGQWADAPRYTLQWVGVGAGQKNARGRYDAIFDSEQMLKALEARARKLRLMNLRSWYTMGMGGGTDVGRGYRRLDISMDFPLNKLISDMSTHAICYDWVNAVVRFTLLRRRAETNPSVWTQLLPKEYRKPWEASWRTTALRHALHMRIQPLQDLLAKAASHYTEAQMQSAVSEGRPMPELGRLCRDMKDIADEIPGLIENDSLYPISANYPLIHRRLIEAHRTAYEVFRLCEQPERWNVTTLPLIAQQFGQQAKGLSRSQGQRAELERARAQTQREETDRASR